MRSDLYCLLFLAAFASGLETLNRDAYLVVSQSRATSKAYFNGHVKPFLKKFAARRGNIKLGILTYESLGVREIGLGKCTDQPCFDALIDGIPVPGGGRCTSDALGVAAANLMMKGSKDPLIFALTDGPEECDDADEPIDKRIEQVRGAGIKLVGLGIGENSKNKSGAWTKELALMNQNSYLGKETNGTCTQTDSALDNLVIELNKRSQKLEADVNKKAVIPGGWKIGSVIKVNYAFTGDRCATNLFSQRDDILLHLLVLLGDKRVTRDKYVAAGGYWEDRQERTNGMPYVVNTRYDLILINEPDVVRFYLGGIEFTYKHRTANPASDYYALAFAASCDVKSVELIDAPASGFTAGNGTCPVI